MGSDELIKFEEQNFDDLVDKFLKIKAVRDLWDDFVYEQYQDSLQDAPDDDSLGGDGPED